MKYNETTRALTNSTGYVKRKDTGEVYKNNKIYLGIFDLPENYEESTKVEYDEYLLKR